MVVSVSITTKPVANGLVQYVLGTDASGLKRLAAEMLPNNVAFLGAIDCGANPNYPAGNRGNLYRISVAGRIGGASGTVVEAGDMMICNTDASAAGNQATVGANWNIINKNLIIGTDVQAYNANLAAIAALASAANKLPYATGSGTWALADISAYGRTLIDDADASTALSTLGISTFAKTILDDTSVGAMLTTLGFSAFVQTLANAADQAAFLTALGISTTYLLPVGSIIPFMGITPPTGWLECDGAAISRTTYANLFNALSGTFTGTTANGNAAMSSLSEDVNARGLVGCYVTGTGVPAATYIAGRIGATGLNLSALATASGSGTFRFYRGAGAGDGSTTFNLPDLRGEFLRGWDHGRNVDMTADRGLGGTFEADKLKEHAHDIQGTQLSNTTATGAANRISTLGSGGVLTTTDGITGGIGAGETRPRNVSVMYCIKT